MPKPHFTNTSTEPESKPTFFGNIEQATLQKKTPVSIVISLGVMAFAALAVVLTVLLTVAVNYGAWPVLGILFMIAVARLVYAGLRAK